MSETDPFEHVFDYFSKYLEIEPQISTKKSLLCSSNVDKFFHFYD